MKKFKDYTVAQYLRALSQKEPIPGGGSAAALVGALGTGLISMVGNYSVNKGKPPAVEKKIKNIIREADKIRSHLQTLIDLDAQAYLQVVKARHAAPKIKKRAEMKAQQVPREICRLCYKAVQLAPFLVTHGNKYLIGDLEAAVDMLLASFNAALHFAHQS